MRYIQPMGEVDLAAMMQRQATLMDPWTDSPFKWKSEYLPIVLAFVGGSILLVVWKQKKKRSKK